MYRKDRGTIRDARGGGVLIYINAKYVSLINDSLNSFKCETLWIKIITGMNGFFNLGVCYRSQNAPSEEVENLFMVVKEASKHQAVIVGDFNFPGINWNTLEYNTVFEEIFIKIVQDSFLTQHVKEPTGQLDLVLTTEPNMIDNLTVKENFSASDHQMVECELIAETVVNEVIKIRYCYDKANYMYDEIKKALNDNGRRGYSTKV